MRARFVSILVSVILGATLLVFTARVDIYEQERAETDTHVNTVRHASVLRAKLEGALNARLHLAYGLAAYARSHSVALTNFASFAEGLYNSSGVSGIRSLQLAPKAIVTYVYPLEGNERAVGHDILSDPTRREAVLRTIEERKFLLAGPFPLLQGGFGLVARLPLYIGPKSADTFWGFATVVLNPDPIFVEGGINPPLDTNFEIALRGRDARGADGEVFIGDPALFQKSPVLLDISLPYGNWQLAVRPVKGWQDRSPYSTLIWLAGIALAVVASALAYTQLQAPVELRAQVIRATQALRESEEQFRSVAESAMDAIISTDSDERVVFWNLAAEKIFQRPAQEAMGQDLTSLVLPAKSSALERNDFLASESLAARDLNMRRADGTIFPAEMTRSNWRQGPRAFSTVIIRDISDRRAAEQERIALREHYFQAQKMEAIGTLASGTAHEFNNILNSLLAATEKAISELPEDSQAAQTLSDVLNSGWRAAEIVQNLLAFSEASESSSDNLSPSTAIARLIPQLETLSGKNIQFESSNIKSDSLVRMEFDQFCHLIWNLCNNAVTAMQDNGGILSVALNEVGADGELPAFCPSLPGFSNPARLTLGELRPARYALIVVSDTGSGMDDATLSRAFDPFFTTLPVGAGSGLGLSIVLGIIQGHGGCIEVATQVGVGTSMAVYLPIISPTVQSAPASSPREVPCAAS